MRKSARKIAAFVLVCSLLLGSVQTTYADAVQDSIKELNSRIEELDKEQKKLDSDISKAKNDKDKKLAEKKKLDSEVKIAKEQISLMTERITLLQNDIEQKELEIQNTQSDIDENYDLFKKRLRAMYMTNNSSQIGLILGAESFSEALSKAELLTSIAEHDKVLLDTLIENKKNIEEAKAEIELSKEEVDNSKLDMETKKKQLDGMVQTTSAEIHDIDKLAAQFAQNKAAKQKEAAEIESQIQQIYASMNSTGTYDGGTLLWPAPGYSKISSDYGLRFGGSDYHTGTDIAGPGIMGQKIVAAADGTVFTVVNGTTGYGKFLIIDHGGGVSTLYAHTSAILVSEGQTVKRGQEIAKVGSTGNSTGPHLHFEVRESKNGQKGQPVNPWSYLK